MPQISNLDQAFDEYLQTHNADHHTMRECWRAAARWMAYDILNTLCDYGTACAGLPAELMSPTQKFDEVHDSLTIYLNQVLKDNP